MKRLKKLGNHDLLDRLASGVPAHELVKKKKHQVFRLSFDAKKLEDIHSINTVLDYMHHNPVTGKWSLVEDFVSYPYFSAGF